MFIFLLYQVFSETLRLYPAAEGINKTIEKPIVLGKYFFPAGSEVGVKVNVTVIYYLYLTLFSVVNGCKHKSTATIL